MATLKDMVLKMFCEKGLQEAASVEVVAKDGTRLTIHSDDHPALSREASEFESVTPRQTAEGGN